MNPYQSMDAYAFWKNSIANDQIYFPDNIYQKKFDIVKTDKIATAGSCFAQHVGKSLKSRGFGVMDYEPSPWPLPKEIRQKFGYEIYSARYGNIYTSRQLLQLIQEVLEIKKPENYIWQKNNRYYDAIRPNIEPDGFESIEELLYVRSYHILKVKQLFQDMDIFVFTLGLTETWQDKKSLTAYPTAPGVIAGHYDSNIFEFNNLNYLEISSDLITAINLLNQDRDLNNKIKFVFTVSPVPLAATALPRHALVSTTYSKSVLRSVAGYLSDNNPFIDYFPSFELIANPWSTESNYLSNMRDVNPKSVSKVMDIFLKTHTGNISEVEPVNNKTNIESTKSLEDLTDVVCEEMLLEAFSKLPPTAPPIEL